MIWQAWEKTLVRQRGYHAIYFAASLQPHTVLTRAERQMLDREGANIRISDVKNETWPVKIGITANLVDAQTPNLDSGSADYCLRVHWRLWASSKRHAVFLQIAARKSVQSFPDSEPMRKSFVSGGPYLDFLWVLGETQLLASDKGVWTKTDAELKPHLRSLRDGMLDREIARFSKGRTVAA